MSTKLNHQVVLSPQMSVWCTSEGRRWSLCSLAHSVGTRRDKCRTGELIPYCSYGIVCLVVECSEFVPEG